MHLNKLPFLFKHNIKFASYNTIRNLSKDVKNNESKNAGELVINELNEGDKKGIFVINFNRPKAKNALGKDLVDQFSMVKGVFCGGADLKERLVMPQNQICDFVEKLRLMSYELSEFPVPTIAAIDGFALGGGLELALACDMRISSNEAKMGLVETSLAILPGAGGSQRLPRLIGISKAKELVFTSKVLTGLEAEKIGLVNYAYPQNLDGNIAYSESIELAKKILPQGPLGIKAAKFAINKGIDVDLKSGLDYEKQAYATVVPTKDRVEALNAFIEKRKPNFKGE